MAALILILAAPLNLEPSESIVDLTERVVRLKAFIDRADELHWQSVSRYRERINAIDDAAQRFDLNRTLRDKRRAYEADLEPLIQALDEMQLRLQRAERRVPEFAA